jgi:hypothetical protein
MSATEETLSYQLPISTAPFSSKRILAAGTQHYAQVITLDCNLLILMTGC